MVLTHESVEIHALKIKKLIHRCFGASGCESSSQQSGEVGVDIWQPTHM